MVGEVWVGLAHLADGVRVVIFVEEVGGVVGVLGMVFVIYHFCHILINFYRTNKYISTLNLKLNNVNNYKMKIKRGKLFSY